MKKFTIICGNMIVVGSMFCVLSFTDQEIDVAEGLIDYIIGILVVAVSIIVLIVGWLIRGIIIVFRNRKSS